MRNTLKVAIAALGFATLAAGCGGGNQTTLQAPLASLDGSWSVVLERAAGTNDCTNDSFNKGTFTLPLTVAHTSGSNSFSVTSTPLSVSATGTISGGDISFSMTPTLSYCQTLTVNIDLVLGPSHSIANGTASWTCVNTGATCTGNDLVTATKQ